MTFGVMPGEAGLNADAVKLFALAKDDPLLARHLLHVAEGWRALYDEKTRPLRSLMDVLAAMNMAPPPGAGESLGVVPSQRLGGELGVTDQSTLSGRLPVTPTAADPPRQLPYAPRRHTDKIKTAVLAVVLSARRPIGVSGIQNALGQKTRPESVRLALDKLVREREVMQAPPGSGLYVRMPPPVEQVASLDLMGSRALAPEDGDRDAVLERRVDE